MGNENQRLSRVEISEIERNKAEAAKLNLEAQEVEKRLHKKWYSGRILIQSIAAGIIVAGLLAGWFIEYFQPILRKKQEIAELNISIQKARAEIKISKMGKERDQIKEKFDELTTVNDSLQDEQAKLLDRTKTQQERIARFSRNFSEILRKNQLSAKDMELYAKQSSLLEKEDEILEKEIEKLRLDIKATKNRSEQIAQQKEDYAYILATSLKVEALALMDKATESYNVHKDEIEEFQTKLNLAYEYAKGRPNNELLTRQWEIMIDPDRYLIGGFIRRWKEDDKLGKIFIEEAKQGLVSQAFDWLIGLESGKIKKKHAKIVGGGS